MKKIFIAVALCGALSFLPFIVAAQSVPSPAGSFGTPPPAGTLGGIPPPAGSFGCSGGNIGNVCNPLGSTTSFCQLIKTLLNVIIVLGVPIATFFVVYAGFKLVIARGNPGALEKARNNLMWVIIGIAVFLGAWLLAQVISNTIAALGITILGSCTA